MLRFKRIVVKIGSNVLTRPDGTLDVTRISALVAQIAELKKNNMDVILVSSGAVASGRSELNLNKKLDTVSMRQIYSSVGQAKLINRYYELFREHGLVCGQVLTTKENFSSRRHYLNQKNCISVMLENDVIPIVNENDTISVTELMFTDNDELSGLIASMMNVEALVLLSNVDGIYDGVPGSPDAAIIWKIPYDKPGAVDFIQTTKSQFGRGGMMTKYNIARKIASEGIAVIIANGKKENILPNLLKKNSSETCTTFIPNESLTSNVKKWIAHSNGFAKGEIHINAGAREALMGNKATSLLPVGVIKVLGEFEKDDIVKIMDEKKQQIGMGKVRYDSQQAAALVGKPGNRPIIHYDYLYVE